MVETSSFRLPGVIQKLEPILFQYHHFNIIPISPGYSDSVHVIDLWAADVHSSWCNSSWLVQSLGPFNASQVSSMVVSCYSLYVCIRLPLETFPLDAFASFINILFMNDAHAPVILFWISSVTYVGIDIFRYINALQKYPDAYMHTYWHIPYMHR